MKILEREQGPKIDRAFQPGPIVQRQSQQPEGWKKKKKEVGLAGVEFHWEELTNKKAETVSRALNVRLSCLWGKRSLTKSWISKTVLQF